MWRNDEISVDDALAARPDAIVLSPGPCTPNEAGHLSRSHSRGERVDADPRRLPRPSGDRPGLRRHGEAARRRRCTARSSRISHNARGLFRGLNGPFKATRYHSLIIERESAPEALEISAESDDGLIMAVAHRDLPVHGVQFHPESIESEHGHAMLRNFLDLARAFNQRAEY